VDGEQWLWPRVIGGVDTTPRAVPRSRGQQKRLPWPGTTGHPQRGRATTTHQVPRTAAAQCIPFLGSPSDIAACARWVHAELVGAIEYRDFGVTLRHPSWKGLRAGLDSALVALPKTTHR
jgi:hypothetical protein